MELDQIMVMLLEHQPYRWWPWWCHEGHRWPCDPWHTARDELSRIEHPGGPAAERLTDWRGQSY